MQFDPLLPQARHSPLFQPAIVQRPLNDFRTGHPPVASVTARGFVHLRGWMPNRMRCRRRAWAFGPPTSSPVWGLITGQIPAPRQNQLSPVSCLGERFVTWKSCWGCPHTALVPRRRLRGRQARIWGVNVNGSPKAWFADLLLGVDAGAGWARNSLMPRKLRVEYAIMTPLPPSDPLQGQLRI